MIRALGLAAVLVAWAAVTYGNRAVEVVNPALLPTPGEVAAVTVALARDGSLARDVLVSSGRIVAGFGLAAVAALALGLAVALYAPARLAVEPLVEFLRPIPPLAFLPMFLVWFGLGETSKVAFIAYTTFFPMLVGVTASLLRVDVMLLRAAASLGATRRDLVRRVVLPAALPGIVVALRLGFGLAIFVIVGAEFMGADAGLGNLIMEGRVFFNPAQIVMGALLLGVLGSLVNALLVALERRTLGKGAAMRYLTMVLATLVVLAGAGVAAAQKPELAEVDAWLVRDAQMSSQFAVADQLGYFKEQGIKVNPRWYIAGTDLPSMWGAGNIHLGTATATMVVPIAASGQAIYNIAPQSDIAGTQQIVLGKRGQELVRSPKDLEKLKIGMPKGASVTMAIESMARDTGVDFSKIQFVNLAPPDGVTALAKGDIDAMAGWAPWVFNAVKNGGKVYFTGNRSFIPGKEGQVDWLLVHAGVVASGKMLKENPNTLKAILRALEKATKTINTDREAAVKIVARETKTEEGLTRDIMALNIYSMEMTPKIAKGMSEFVEFLYSLKRIPSKVAPESLFYTKLLKEVDPKLVKWDAATEVK